MLGVGNNMHTESNIGFLCYIYIFVCVWKHLRLYWKLIILNYYWILSKSWVRLMLLYIYCFKRLFMDSIGIDFYLFSSIPVCLYFLTKISLYFCKTQNESYCESWLIRLPVNQSSHLKAKILLILSSVFSWLLSSLFRIWL